LTEKLTKITLKISWEQCVDIKEL